MQLHWPETLIASPDPPQPLLFEESFILGAKARRGRGVLRFGACG